MWIKRTHFVVLSFRIRNFRLPIAVLPLRCAMEIVEDVANIICLFRPVANKAIIAVDMVENFLMETAYYGKLDLVDVDVKSKKENVRFKILMR